MPESPTPTPSVQSSGPFPTTRWTIVRQSAEGNSQSAKEALESLCREYWKPLLIFVKAQTAPGVDAEDIVQEFLAKFVESGGFTTAREDEGRLRNYLLKSLSRFMIDLWRKDNAEKRGGKSTSIPIQEVSEAEMLDASGPVDLAAAEMAFDKQWAKTTMLLALDHMEGYYKSRGNTEAFPYLKKVFLAYGDDAVEKAEAMEKLGITRTNTLDARMTRFRQRFRKALEAVVVGTVASPADVPAELAHLKRMLGME